MPLPTWKGPDGAAAGAGAAGAGSGEWVYADEDGIVVTPGMAFGDGGRGYFRISLVRDRDTLARAAATIGARREAMLQRA